MDRALSQKVNTDHAFKAVRELRKKGIEIPFILMTYYNIVLQYGEERFFKECSRSGVDGVLISDLPLEESKGLKRFCIAYQIDPIFLIAPNTPDDRIKRIIGSSRGFVYLVSLLGVTGERKTIERRTFKAVKKALEFTRNIPLAVGFGISNKAHVEALISSGADGVVVGSAFVKIVEKNGKNSCVGLEAFAKELKEGTKKRVNT